MSLIYAPINELPFATNFEGNDYLLIWDISQPANQARRLTFTALASFLAYTSREFEWADIINKPDAFPPASHTHIPADILGFDSAVDERLVFSISSIRMSATATTGLIALTSSPVLPSSPFYLISCEISLSSPPLSANNYWIAQPAIFAQLAGGGALLGQPIAFNGNPPQKAIFAVEVTLGGAASHRLQAISLVRVGNAPSCTYAISYNYRLL
jgi:hypothetical protein